MVIESSSSGKSKKKKSTAIILNLILLGCLGLHRFYVGKKTISSSYASFNCYFMWTSRNLLGNI